MDDGSYFTLGGCLYVTGGSDQLSSVERSNTVANTWTAATDMLEGRHSFAAVTIGSAGPAEEEDLFDSLIAKSSPQS